MKKKFIFYTLLLLVILSITSCGQKYSNGQPILKSINIMDRNGLSETLSSKDRLAQFENVDFLKTQPYQKVLRVYERDVNGDIKALITSYHPNGQPKQYLEIVNNRALGNYREWYSNGTLKVETYIIGGEADIDTAAEQSWLFDGCSRAWDEDGHLVAEMFYEKGLLEGTSNYYHSNGNLWKQMPYKKGQLQGATIVYLPDSSLLQITNYVDGIKHGSAQRFWPGDKISSEETYCKGDLINARYHDCQGNCIASIDEGNGLKALFGKDSLSELHSYRNGKQEGEITVFASDGSLYRKYSTKNQIKDGEEILYYDPIETQGKQIPKLSVNWIEGKIQGTVKTWYPTGVQESQKEMSLNKKNGLFTAWYLDGSLMMIEEYAKNKLVRGEYYMPGEKLPISTIRAGEGIATLFDPKGTFVRKIHYSNSKPLE